MDRREAGRKGGRKLAEERGAEYMRRIGRNGGKKGIRGLAARYFDGSVGRAMEWLRSRRTELQVMRGLEEKQTAELASGKEIVCEELPVFCDPDLDPSYWRDRAMARKDAEIDIPF